MGSASALYCLTVVGCISMHIYCANTAEPTLTPSTNCTDNKTCSDVPIAHSYCDTVTTKKCVCENAFKANGATCVPKVLDDACQQDTDCDGVASATCDTETKTCTCAGTFKVGGGGTCIKRVIGATCSQATAGDCTVTNSGCISDLCACVNSSYAAQDDQCKTAIGVSCTSTSTCPTDATCNKECMCNEEFTAENGLCVAAIGKACSKASDCVENAECDEDKCKCSSGYDNSNGLCLQKSSANSLTWTIRTFVLSLVLLVLGN